MNRPISKKELLLALRKTNRKAADRDVIIGELLRNAFKFDFVLNYLVQMFNVLFNKGIFHEHWTESTVLPLHKKGDANNPNNYMYRNVSLRCK